MIILSTPDDIQNYLALDEDVDFILEQKGEHPKYMENGYMFFKRTNKLIKLIKKLGIDKDIDIEL